MHCQRNLRLSYQVTSTHREDNRRLLIQQPSAVEESLYVEAADCCELALHGVLSAERPISNGAGAGYMESWLKGTSLLTFVVQ